MNDTLQEKIMTIVDALCELADHIREFLDDLMRAVYAAIHTAISVRKHTHKCVRVIGRPQRGYPRGIRATARSFPS